MSSVIKTTFEEEQKIKDEAFLKLSPLQRLDLALRVRSRMYKPGIDYSYQGRRVMIKKAQ